MRWLITWVWPLTPTCLPPNSSLSARMRALSQAAFLVALLLHRIKLDFLAAGRVVINERHMP